MESGMTERLTFHSAKISGDGDAERLETDLSSVDGVRSVEVSGNNKSVTIVYDPTMVNVARLQIAVEDAGYPIDSDTQ